MREPVGRAHCRCPATGARRQPRVAGRQQDRDHEHGHPGRAVSVAAPASASSPATAAVTSTASSRASPRRLPHIDGSIG
jgi:hypothetical protein